MIIHTINRTKPRECATKSIGYRNFLLIIRELTYLRDKQVKYSTSKDCLDKKKPSALKVSF